jgi:CheY-like chemotaxis protein
MNLLVNARDAMPEGGRISIHASDMDAPPSENRAQSAGASARWICLTLSDTGQGMPTQIVSQIFDPFFTTKEIGKGTGLGLSTVSAIVQSHGGSVDVQSAPGVGTTFRLIFPAVVASAGRPVPLVGAPLRGNGELILVVDDELPIREVARRTLERFGYRVLTAADGREAVALYTEHGEDIALVFTDMSMPHLDGPGTIRALRAMNPAVRIIVASGLGPVGSLDHDSLAGVRHFIPKPFSTETLLHDVRMVLDDTLPRDH